jgi:hypothetical protein
MSSNPHVAGLPGVTLAKLGKLPAFHFRFRHHIVKKQWDRSHRLVSKVSDTKNMNVYDRRAGSGSTAAASQS